MTIYEFDKVRLRSGETAYIVEILEAGKMYMADIDRSEGTETDWLKHEDIQEILPF